MKTQGHGNIFPRSDEQPTYVVHIAALRATQPAEFGFVQVLYGATPGDGLGGLFYAATGAEPETYVDNGATIIVPAGGDGSSAWLADSASGASAAQTGPVTIEVTGNHTVSPEDWGASDPSTDELTVFVLDEGEDDGATITLPGFGDPILNGTRVRIVKASGDFAVIVANEGVPGIQINDQGGLGNSIDNSITADGSVNNPRWQVSLEMRNGDWVWYGGLQTIRRGVYALSIDYSPGGSGLVATNVQDAIDELKALIDALP